MHYVAVVVNPVMPTAVITFESGDNTDFTYLENLVKNMYIDQFPNANSDKLTIEYFFKSESQIDRAV